MLAEKQSMKMVKMDTIMKNMLILALGDVMREEKKKGGDPKTPSSLILKLDATPEGKLFLEEEEYRLVICALNKLRDTYLAKGRYSDGIDKILYKILRAKYRKCAVR